MNKKILNDSGKISPYLRGFFLLRNNFKKFFCLFLQAPGLAKFWQDIGLGLLWN